MRVYPSMLLLGLASCGSCDDPPKRADAAAPPSSLRPSASVSARASAEAAVDAAAPAATAVAPAGDAGASWCRLAYGPAEQSFRGPAALAVVGQELRVVANDAGKPRTFVVAAGPPGAKGAPAVLPPAPTSLAAMRWPPCEIAGKFAYCQAPGGPITRTNLATNETKQIAKSRAGTRIAAAPIGVDHSVVAFLEIHRTSEGDMLQAFVALDESEPVRLSDEGAGATTLRFLARGESPVAVYLDSRTAMVPIHARAVTMKEGKLALASDVVLFVGGAPERGIDFAVATAGPKSFAFVPMPKETTDFGMAAIPIEDPPAEDVGATWSRYPNGLDPAPIAATPSKDGKSAWVVRTRPQDKEVGSPKVLELGRVDASATFTSFGVVAEASQGKGFGDVAIVEDAAGAVWLAYATATSTWLERRVCK